jgi:L-ascorbate metabolism protein UlaG (beta-lactamase superfamily)
MLPIGAYEPEYVMRLNHTDPEESVRAFNELNGKIFMPMHYGTFDLSDEPRGEPMRWLKRLESENKIKGKLIAPEIGEIVVL